MNRDKRLDKYFLGGLLKTAGSVAGQALIPVPGVGAAIGGYVGGALGNAIDPQEQMPSQMAANAPTYYPPASRGNTHFANGGRLPGTAMKVKGPRHERGGVALRGIGAEVEGGETIQNKMVFSDRVRVPGQSITFAKAHERLLKQGGNDESVQRLFKIQQKTTGGKNSSKMEDGGVLGEEEPSFLSKVAPYAGDLINIGRGLFSSTDVPEPTRVDRSHIARMPSRVDVSADRAQNRSALRSITSNPNANTNTKLAAHSNFIQGSHRIEQDRENREVQLQTNIARAEGAANNVDAGFRNQARTEQQAADAARENILSEGVAGLSRTYQHGQNLEAAKQSDSLGFMQRLIVLLDPIDRQAMYKSIEQYLPPHLQGIAFKPGVFESMSLRDQQLIEEALRVNMPQLGREQMREITVPGVGR